MRITEVEFIKKYGEQYHYVWRNEQLWIESKKPKKEKQLEKGHEMWEGGG